MKIARYRRRLDGLTKQRQAEIAKQPDTVIMEFSAVSVSTVGLVDRFGPAVTRNTLRLAALQTAYIDAWNALGDARSLHHAECILSGFMRRKIEGVRR